jgi:hypothetical protein
MRRLILNFKYFFFFYALFIVDNIYFCQNHRKYAIIYISIFSVSLSHQNDITLLILFNNIFCDGFFSLSKNKNLISYSPVFFFIFFFAQMMFCNFFIFFVKYTCTVVRENKCQKRLRNMNTMTMSNA